MFLINRTSDENNNKPPVKKFKVGSLDDVNNIIDEKIAIQNQEFFELREDIERLKMEEMINILKSNLQFVPEEKSDVILFKIFKLCIY